MTSEQKQAQAARCPCKGTDDYCPCQNVRLDQAWEEINALGGSQYQDNSYDQGLVDTVAKVLGIIEALGGVDPKQRQAASQGSAGGEANQKTRCENCNLLARCDDPLCPNAVAQAGRDPFVVAVIAEDAKWPDPILDAQAARGCCSRCEDPSKCVSGCSLPSADGEAK